MLRFFRNLIACSAAAMAAPVATVWYSSPTTTVVQVTGVSGTCGVTMTESGSPVTAYHPNDYSWADSTLNVVLERLSPDTAYTAQMTGCPTSSNTVSWTTPTIPNGTTQSPYPGFDPACYGNWPLMCTEQSFDWRDATKVYRDTATGAKIKPILTNKFTARTGGTSGGSNNFANWLGGSGWTNPSNIVSGGQATTGNTNPLDLFVDASSEPGNAVLPYSYYWTLHDFGVVPVCGGSSATAADRQLQFRIYTHGSAVGNTVTITCPQGSPAAVLSGSSDPDGAWPAAFPSVPFYGWSGSSTPIIRMQDQETVGTATVTGTSVVIGSPSKDSYFSDALTSSDYIYLAGSGCTNNMCAVSSVTDATTLTTSSSPGNGSKAFRAYGWFLRVTKANASGTITFSLKYKLAAGQPTAVTSGGDICGTVAVTSGDGITGYPCQFTMTSPGESMQVFIGNDGTIRPYSAISNVGFDKTNPKILYQGSTNGGGGYTILKKTYTGDYTASFGYNYGCTFSFGCPDPGELMTSTDIMSGNDLNTQIAANFSSQYNQSIYGAWTIAGGGVTYVGVSGDYGFFYKYYGGGGQDTGAAWIAAVYLPTGTVTRLCHILDGDGCTGFKYSSLHSTQPQIGLEQTIFVSGNTLNANNSSIMHGGPFQGTVDRVLRSGSWSTNTALPWPPDGTYDGACPANSYGATTCVTLRMNLGFCNIAPSASELLNFTACPWNGSYTQPVTWAVGDHFYDSTLGNYDNEHFRILSLTDEGGGKWRVVAMRNAVYDYCSYTPWQGQANATSAQLASQLQHTTGWTPQAAPGLVGCGNLVGLWKVSTNDTTQLGRSAAVHFHIGKNSGSTINFVEQPLSLYSKTFSNIGDVPPDYTYTNMSFSSIANGVGTSLQSYTDQSAWGQTSNYNRAIDNNPIVACSFEGLGCGPARTLTSVTGNIYTITSAGTGTQSLAGYKYSPLYGWAGAYSLKDVSGPASDITATAYSMCLAGAVNECYAGSTAGQIYVNVPKAYNPGYGTASVDWANIPTVMMGNHAPAAMIREFGINTADTTGTSSRGLSFGFTSPGRQQPYTHSTQHPSGTWIINMGQSIVDGFSLAGALVKAPSQDSQARATTFESIPVTVGSGAAYAEVRFGYTPSLNCTARPEACSSAGSPYSFVSESRTLTSCTSGCTINIPVLRDKLAYYRVYRGSNSNGSDAVASGDVLTWGIQQGSTPPVTGGGSRISGKSVLRGVIH